MPLTILPCRTQADIADTKKVFEAYAGWIESELGYSLSKQSFDAEFNGLPGRYAAPDGEILIARKDGVLAGAIAFYKLTDAIAELKRFYVFPSMGGGGIGYTLFGAALEMAKARGYTHIRLDTLKGMVHARKLYARYRFYEIAPYNDNYKDTPDLLYYERTLTDLT